MVIGAQLLLFIKQVYLHLKSAGKFIQQRLTDHLYITSRVFFFPISAIDCFPLDWWVKYLISYSDAIGKYI